VVRVEVFQEAALVVLEEVVLVEEEALEAGKNVFVQEKRKQRRIVKMP